MPLMYIRSFNFVDTYMICVNYFNCQHNTGLLIEKDDMHSEPVKIAISYKVADKYIICSFKVCT